MLILLISACLPIGYLFHFSIKYLLVSVSVLVLFIWCKDVFTGSSWFGKPKPILQIHNSQSVTMNDEEHGKHVTENYPPISEQVKSGYITLTKLCLAPEKQTELIAFFEHLKDFSEDEYYITTLNYVMEYADKQNLFFIMSLDWKQDIETLVWRLENALYKNFNLAADFLPSAKDYDKRTSVSSDNVFEDFDNSLKKKGLQIGFIDTQSDEYVIFVHKTADKQAVEIAVNEIGYKYF